MTVTTIFDRPYDINGNLWMPFDKNVSRVQIFKQALSPLPLSNLDHVPATAA